MRARPPRSFGLILVIGCGLGAAWCSGSTPSVADHQPSDLDHAAADQHHAAGRGGPRQPDADCDHAHAPPAGSTWINVLGDTGWCGSPVMTAARAADGEPGRRHPVRRRSRLRPRHARRIPPLFRSGLRALPHPILGGARQSRIHDQRRRPDSSRISRTAPAPIRPGIYALRIAGWQVLMLNSNVPMNRGSRQHEFVRLQLQSAPRCTLAVWHHPFDSSGPNGPNPTPQRDLWELLYNNNADVVVSAHDHLYERHAPMNASGQSDPVRGVRLFISGGGGAPPYQRARAARPVGAPHLNARTAAPQARTRALRVGVPGRERERSRSRTEHLPLIVKGRKIKNQKQVVSFSFFTFNFAGGFGNVPSRIAA